MKSADLLVKCLEQEDVRYVFGIPGEENIELMESLLSSDVRFVLTKHENSAAFMAETCAKLTNRPNVCLSTLGPGATNMVTGVADAYLSRVPLIALTGQVGTERAYHPQKQYLDLVDLYRPVTKESFSIRTPTRIATQMRRAFDLAAAERPGPVHIELPEDVMRMEIAGEPVPKAHIHQVLSELESVQKVRDVLTSAERPIIFVGPGVIRNHATEQLRKFARAWNVPVVHSWYGAGIMPYDDELSLNTVGLRTADTVRGAFEMADAVVLVGYDLPEFSPIFWNIGRAKQVAVIDAVPAETSPHFAPQVQLIGNIASILSKLMASAVTKENWTLPYKEDLLHCLDHSPEDGSPVKPQLIVKAIRQALGRSDICVSDVGAHLIWLAKRYPVYKENTLLLSNGLIPMGVGVPSAIASKLMHPERKVVAACGDAGFMMTATELETAKRLGTDFVSVIFNDGDLGLIKYKHEKAYGHAYDTSFRNPDFVKFAEAFGAQGYRVSSAKELEEVLCSSLRDQELAVIDVPVDYSENQGLM